MSKRVSKKRALVSWAPFLLWVGVILVISSQSSPPGAETVGSKLGGHSDWVFHFVEYAIAAYLAYRAVASGGLIGQPHFRYMVAFVLPFVIACVDEGLQGFVPGRTASALGIASALTVTGIASRLYRGLLGRLRSI